MVSQNNSINAAKLMGGKRKNGHKMDCTCHICENMHAKAKRNGYEEDLKKEQERKMGPQKKNGHKKDCDCPICKNMKNVSSNKNLSKTNLNNKKKSNGHKENCECPICKNMNKNKRGGSEDTNTTIDDTIDDTTNTTIYDDITTELIKGGTRKKRGTRKMNRIKSKKNKKSNGHKINCKCPICKNMNKKTRKNK